MSSNVVAKAYRIWRAYSGKLAAFRRSIARQETMIIHSPYFIDNTIRKSSFNWILMGAIHHLQSID
jgi:hypothetical protein